MDFLEIMSFVHLGIKDPLIFTILMQDFIKDAGFDQAFR